jgi:hypothetical protein
MNYKPKSYIVLLEVARFYLNSMISFQATVAVLFTGMFCVKMLSWVEIDSRVGDMIFIPCAVYFFWALLISIVDMNIERDML